ncbi:hypothetical protein [Aquibacillus salsiterrae]|uniref:Fimbrial assembly protein n=1 Tax=Aquibacillus salsiterrae TaxID=2950439 RepID=A0A9X3WDZ5_9BACI|nr:hypothetical protein [Aquibacillus salsiterrae]MDC3416973.1 hypothetical protein [Aquibacillus salsiterrae]
MNVSIDLLPQSRRITVSRLPLFIVLAVAVFTMAGLSVVYYLDAKNNVAELGDTIVTQTELRDNLLAEYQTKTSGVTEYNFVDEYKYVNSLLNQTYIGTIELKNSVFQLFPKGVDVQSYNYQNTGALTMTVDFPSKQDAATYLNRLLFADFTTEAQVTAISTNEQGENYLTNVQMNVKTVVEGGEANESKQ